jgi:hypothetical protein
MFVYRSPGSLASISVQVMLAPRSCMGHVVKLGIVADLGAAGPNVRNAQVVFQKLPSRVL